MTAESSLSGLRAERRQVSVLFVDLVGFTSLSEDRDPEVVRELLSEYFEQARTIVGRYGGVIEKFIGDAVMAVWGTPVAREDDAERGVRAGLDLVDAVAALGEDSDGLRARAGVVTGEAAVRLDAVGQGMVAGDVVNTAARVQSAATPGSVWVDDTTRDASVSSIGFAEAGSHGLKGKAEPVRLWRAVQVVAGAGGSQRFDGLEAPFVGRDRELRVVKELFHDSAEQPRARLVLVSGVAGVGKSRLGWEFFKYLDGIAAEVFWQVGRCLSYGDGIAYWALAEMVRMRLRISEGDPPQVVAARLDEGLATYLEDVEDRAWVRPRLAVLLGIGEGDGQELERESLYAGWRLFLEQLAHRHPVVLVFEDLQHADVGLLDFVDHLLERSVDLPIFILGLTRPELFDQRPAWGGAHRGITSLAMDPLVQPVMSEIVGALVSGLPEQTREALAARAEGIPLFAIETVRMLIDRDVVVPQGGEYVLAGEIGDVGQLEVPPTLQALVAARLDNLPEPERRLVKDAAVLGLSFTPAAIVAIEQTVQGVPVEQVEHLLARLARREIVTVRDEARSPEAGQYRFVQKVMRTVAYDTLSRRDRKARHLAAAEYWQASPDTDIAGVIASHYLAAADAVPEAPDADRLRAVAVGQLEKAGDRARTLAATDEALRYYEHALDLTTNDTDRARTAEQAGRMARRAGHLDRALVRLTTAGDIHERTGDHLALARIAAMEGEILGDQGRLTEALERMTEAYARVGTGTLDADVAYLTKAIGTIHLMTGDGSAADSWFTRALEASEATGAWDVLAGALNVRAIRLNQIGRPVEARALMRASLDLGVQHGMHQRAAIQAGNLAEWTMFHDLAAAEELALASLDHAHRAGDMINGAFALATAAEVLLHSGHWNRFDTEAVRDQIQRIEAPSLRSQLSLPLVALSCWRSAPALLDGLDLRLDDQVEHVQVRGSVATIKGLLAGAAGDLDDAVEQGRLALDIGLREGEDELLLFLPVTVQRALEAGRVDTAHQILSRVEEHQRGLVPPLMQAYLTWLRARLAVVEGTDESPGQLFVSAADRLRDLGARFWLAWAQLDHATWLAEQGDEARAAEVAGEALDIFTDLQAAPFMARARTLAGAYAAAATVAAGLGAAP